MSQLFCIVEQAGEETVAELLNRDARVLMAKYSATGQLELLYIKQGVLFMDVFLNSSKTSSRQFNHSPDLQLEAISDFFSINQSYFFVTSPRVSISICLAGTKNIVLARFKESFQIEEGCTIDVNLPSIYIFGGKSSSKGISKDFLEVSLMTYQVNNLSKEGFYSPEARFNHLSYLKDDRLYIWGGLSKDSLPINDGLLWTYDFEKSYWFALELSSPILMERSFLRIIEREPNKLCLINIKDAGIYTCDMFQCAVREVKCRRQQGLLGQDPLISRTMVASQDSSQKEGLIVDQQKKVVYKLIVFQKYEDMIKHQLSRANNY